MNYFPNDLDLDDMPELLSCDVDQVCMTNAKFFFLGLFFYVFIESPNPRRLHTTGPKPHRLKTPQKQNMRKIINNNPGK